jgi:superfamily II DNA or RNA helicase
VFSTGINIKNLWNTIFAHPYKSKIKNLQSIGRILRKMSNNKLATLWDIGDDYSWKSKTNTSLKHFNERIKLYIKEGFEYQVLNVKV